MKEMYVEELPQDQSAMVRNIVATIMESQAETITSMANEVIQAVMGQNEE